MAQTTVAINGNSYLSSTNKSNTKITQQGVENWNSPKTEISTYFKLSCPGYMTMAIRAKNGGKPSTIQLTVGNKSVELHLRDSTLERLEVGTFTILDTGYIQVKIRGLHKQGRCFGSIASLEIGGTATEGGVVHSGSFSPYWASRGPSVHLKYELPKGSDTEYFYNELTVGEGNDPVGSYFMACGFAQGYFGMQVNSEKERRILFSVWSPFDTQDPKTIPDSLKIRLIEQGPGVTIGEFGNEGSGGQSYLRYNWSADSTYRFLMRVHPDGLGSTIYTAYFYAPEKGEWQMVASFLRPQTNTHYKNAHSFLENFDHTRGHISRSVEFGNQWACSTTGVWSELTCATFTCDATALAGVRKDYQGGVRGAKFYLKNGGFFNLSTPYLTKLNRPKSGLNPPSGVPNGNSH